jgi:hypothetical protein
MFNSLFDKSAACHLQSSIRLHESEMAPATRAIDASSIVVWGQRTRVRTNKEIIIVIFGAKQILGNICMHRHKW